MNRKLPIARTHEEAVAKIKEMASAEIAVAPVPIKGDRTLYVSRVGEVFQIRDIKGGAVYHQLPIRSDNCVNFTRGARRQGAANVANLVYSAFVSGEFCPERKFGYKDGNPQNRCVENIYPKRDLDYDMTRCRMQTTADLYITQKEQLIRHVELHYALDTETAKDMVDEAYILLCSEKDIRWAPRDPAAFFYRWMCIKIAQVFGVYQRTVRSRFCSMKEWHDVGAYDNDIVELLPFAMSHIKSEKCRFALYLWCLGYTGQEIAEFFGTNANAATGRIIEAKRKLIKEFQKDIDIYYAL